MPDPKLISEQIVAASVADTPLDYNVQNIRQNTRAGQSMLQSGQKVVDAKERRKRVTSELELNRLNKEAGETAAADMVDYTGMLSEMKTSFDLAISQTVDPDEIDKIIDSTESEMQKWIDNPDNLRNSLSQGAASKNFNQNRSQLFKNAGTNRKAAIVKTDTLTKLQRGKIQLSMNPMKDDKVFEAQFKDILAQEVSMGVKTPQQAKLELETTMRQKHRDMAVNITAGFQTELNQINVDANTETARIWSLTTEGAGLEKATAEANKMVDMIDKRYIELSTDLTNRYKESIKELDLTEPEERQLFQKLDADQNYRKHFRSSIKGEIEKAKKAQDNANIQNFQAKQLEPGNALAMASLDTLKSWNLPDDFIEAYQKKWITKRAAQAEKSVNDTMSQIKERVSKGKQNALASTLYRTIENFTPQTDPREINMIMLIAAELPDPTIESQVNAALKAKTDPNIYNKQIDDYIKRRSKEIAIAMGEAEVTVPKSKKERNQFMDVAAFNFPILRHFGVSKERDIRKGELWSAQFNMEEEARRINREKGFEPARKFMDDFFDRVEDDDQSDNAVTQYLSAAVSSDFQQSELPVLAPTDRLDYIQGVPVIIDINGAVTPIPEELRLQLEAFKQQQKDK